VNLFYDSQLSTSNMLFSLCLCASGIDEVINFVSVTGHLLSCAAIDPLCTRIIQQTIL
jgi:hypothetical protein